MKWLIIKAAERLGHTYVHGSALRYQDRNLLFAGDSGSGKSSFLFRLLTSGWENPITDDALLLSNQQIIPFVLNVSMRSDFC
jgi:serine kinase of HPr protein (carbohydrate metabolism regulator)